MPAKSEKQRELMAIAEHHPDQVSAKNKGVLKMSKGQLHDYASTVGAKKKRQRSEAEHMVKESYRSKS